MVKWLSLAFALAAASCAREPGGADTPSPVRLEQVWRLDGFANPESATLDESGAVLFVTNVNGEGEAEDGNGFISRVSLDGVMLEREWARGLDAPKGIARAGNLLYVADINEVAVISALDGSTRERVAVAGARFLNDIAVAPDGLVLVADSATQRIYSVNDGAAEIWLEHDLLNSVNGLLPEPQRLVVTTMAGRLLAIDYESRAVSLLADGLGDADGVAAIGDGRYLVSEWPGLMHVVTVDGSRDTLLDTRSEERYLNDFLLREGVVYQPHWEPSEFSAYRIVQGEP